MNKLKKIEETVISYGASSTACDDQWITEPLIEKEIVDGDENEQQNDIG